MSPELAKRVRHHMLYSALTVAVGFIVGSEAEVLFLNLPGRLAKALLRLSERKPKDQGKLVITQREIGQMVGMSRESANKQLRAWAKLRWVKLERGGIVVLAPEALAMVAAAAADEPEI